MYKQDSYDYVLITGHGRSGTTWLLSLMDLSPLTHCRQEPASREYKKNPWYDLPSRSRHLRKADLLTMEAGWERAVAWSALRVGLRDLPLVVHKQHIHVLAQRLGSDRLIKSRKLRHLINRFYPYPSASEWYLPLWYGNRSALEQALPVFNLHRIPAWTTWVLENQPQAFVLHIVRHPGGYLNSWINFWLNKSNRDEVTCANRQRLWKVADANNYWKQKFGNIAQMSAEESELWFWRYATETIHNVGISSSNYHLIIYEDLVMRTIPVIRRIYDTCGLPWNSTLDQEVKATTSNSYAIASAWKSKLSNNRLDLVTKIINDSPLQELWNNTQISR